MNKLAALLAAAIFAINLMPLSAEAAIPKAAETKNDAVGVTADVPKPGRAKAVSGGAAATKQVTTPARSSKVGEAGKKSNKSKNSKSSKPAKQPAGRS